MNQSNQKIPPPPAWLKGRALERWVALWPTLDLGRVDPMTHGDTVASYCQAYDDWREAVEKVSSMGGVVKDQNNRVVANPYVAIRDNAVRKLTEIGRALGIKPDEPLPRVGSSWSDFEHALIADVEDA